MEIGFAYRTRKAGLATIPSLILEPSPDEPRSTNDENLKHQMREHINDYLSKLKRQYYRTQGSPTIKSNLVDYRVVCYLFPLSNLPSFCLMQALLQSQEFC